MNDGTNIQFGLRKFPRRLAREVKKAAAERGITVSEFMTEAATNQLRQPRASGVSAELQRDVEWYERHRADVETAYPPGTSVAVVGKRIVDSDADVWKLLGRLRERYGSRSIFIPLIGKPRPDVIRVRSPRIVR